jgi:hypothetical protein
VATMEDMLTMEPKEESGDRMAESLSYMIVAIVVALKSVEPRVVTDVGI